MSRLVEDRESFKINESVSFSENSSVDFQMIREAKKGEIFGEIGVLCYRPQPLTVRTKRLCQLLRLNRTSFLNIVLANVGDGTIIMNNLLQVGATPVFKLLG